MSPTISTMTCVLSGRPLIVNRQQTMRDSNNPQNPKKNICSLRVAEAIGVSDNVEFLHTIEDLMEAVRHPMSRWDAIDMTSDLTWDWHTVAAVQHNIRKDRMIGKFIIWVPGHVLLLESEQEGRAVKVKAIVDTDARKSDRRRALRVWWLTRREA